MGASGLFNIGISGLLSYQNALNTTGNNIANVYTPGFTREVAHFSERQGAMGGIGVDYAGNQRLFDGFAETDLRSNLAQYNKLSTYYEYASVLDNYIGNSSGSINQSLEDYFSSLQVTLSSPASIPSRTAFLNNSQTLVSRFQTIDKTIETQSAQLNQSVTTAVNQANELLNSIATLNRSINSNSTQSTGQLLDERDGLIRDLAELLPATPIVINDMANIYLPGGEALVIGGTASEITTDFDPENSKRMEVFVKTDYSSTEISDSISSGKTTGKSDSGTGCGPQASQFITGIGAPQ